MVLDYRRVATAARTPRRKGTAGDEPLNEHAAVLAMQASAGNRATSAALAQVTAQRALGGGSKQRRSTSAGGALTLGTGKPFGVVSATWKREAKAQADVVGGGRDVSLHGGAQSQEIEVVVAGGNGEADRIFDLAQQGVDSGLTFDAATLRLDRRSADGALPASSIDMSKVTIVSVARTSDDPPEVTIKLDVGAMSAAGLGKEASSADAVATAVVSGGAGKWTPIPVLRLDRGPSREEDVGGARSGSLSAKRLGSAQGTKVRAEIAAGPNLARLSEAMSKAVHLDIVFTLKNGQALELQDALVERLSGSSNGPGEVELGLIAERSRTR